MRSKIILCDNADTWFLAFIKTERIMIMCSQNTELINSKMGGLHQSPRWNKSNTNAESSLAKQKFIDRKLKKPPMYFAVALSGVLKW